MRTNKLAELIRMRPAQYRTGTVRYVHVHYQYSTINSTSTRAATEADKGWTGILTGYEMDQFSNEISVGK